MKNTLININETEKILDEFNGRRSRVVVTEKRLVIEQKESSYSILLNMIGAVELIRKSGKKYCLRLYSYAGTDLFALAKDRRLEFLKREDATKFESVLSGILCGTAEEQG